MKLSADRLAVSFVSAAFAGLAITAAGCGQSSPSAEAANSAVVTQVVTQSGTTADAKVPTEEAAEVVVDRQSEEMTSTGNGTEAVRKAAEAAKYLFAFFKISMPARSIPSLSRS